VLLKIGELAKRIGVTVRTLHHYDAIGLVKPSARTEAGYRLYNRNDIARLHRIQALRGLGLSLAETGTMLAGEGAELRMVIRQQITSLQRQISQAVDLRDRLQSMEAQLDGAGEPEIEDWLSTLGLMATHRKYFTETELYALYRGKKFGDEDMPWPGLIAEVRNLMDRRIVPQSVEAKALALRWIELQKRTMSDDPRYFVKLSAMHRTEFDVQALTGVDGPLLDYVTISLNEIRCEALANYVTPDELDRFRRSFPKTMHNWLVIFAEVRQLIEQGVAPGHPDAQEVLQKWIVLFQENWGSDPETRLKVREAHRTDQKLIAISPMSQETQIYITQCMAAHASNSAKMETTQ